MLHYNMPDNELYHEWSAIEKEILIECVNEYGKDWNRISNSFFVWLTPLKLKNKHYALTNIPKKKSIEYIKSPKVEDVTQDVLKRIR